MLSKRLLIAVITASFFCGSQSVGASAEDLNIVVLDQGDEAEYQMDPDDSSELIININDESDGEETVSAGSLFDIDDTANINALLPVYEESGKPRLVSVRHYQDEWEGDTQLAAAEYTTVLLENADVYPALFEVLNTKAQSERTEAVSAYQQMVTDTHEQLSSYGSVYTNFYETSIMMRRADEKIVSLLYLKSQYSGGAHGYTWEEPVTYNAQTGEEIRLEDIFTSTDSLLQIIYDKLNAKYPGLSGLNAEDSFGYWNVVTLDSLLYTLEPESITFYFPTYTLGSYADSSQNISIGFAEYPDLFTDLAAADSSAQVSEIASWYPEKMDVTGDGSADAVEITGNYSGEYDQWSGFSVSINGQEYAFEQEFYSSEFYLVRTTESINLYAFLSVEEDNSLVYVIDMNGGTPAYVTSLHYGNIVWDGAYSSIVYTELFTDPEYFRLCTWTDILGTGRVFGAFSTDDRGVPVLNNAELYSIHPRALTARQDISGDEVNLQDDEMILTGSTAVIPAESPVHMIGTDNSTYADLEAEDGTIIRIPVEPEAYPQTSNGTDIEELLDSILFVG